MVTLIWLYGRHVHVRSLVVARRLAVRLVLDHFDPVVVGVCEGQSVHADKNHLCMVQLTKDKCNVLHPAIRQPLLPLHTLLFEPLASRIQVVDGNANVAETLRLSVAIVVDLALLLLGAVVRRRTFEEIDELAR